MISVVVQITAHTQGHLSDFKGNSVLGVSSRLIAMNIARKLIEQKDERKSALTSSTPIGQLAGNRLSMNLTETCN